MKHRIGLTVTDPNHPMVSKRKETIQKTVRVSGEDREKAINSAIAHYRRKGYKVHDHHYIGTVNEVNDYFKRRQREKDVDAGKPVSRQPKNPQNDYFARRRKDPDAPTNKKAPRYEETIAEGAYEKSEENKRSADAAKKQGDMFAHHMHMSDYHDNLSQWHYEKGRYHASDSHAEKSEKHHEQAMKLKEEVELDEAIKLNSKVVIHAPGKSYHGKVGHVGEIRHGAYKGAPKTYTVDHEGGSTQLDKKNIKMHKEEVEQVDEISRELTHGYFKKAYAQKYKNEPTKPTKLQMKNRDRGMGRATNRLMQRLELPKGVDPSEGGKYTRDSVEYNAPMIEETNMDTRIWEAWGMGKRDPQRGIKVGHQVRSYDFPGMHDDHYIEGHVVGETPYSYHIRTSRVVRGGKEVPIPAHMGHVEAPKGKGMFSDAYAVHKIVAKQDSVAAKPVPAQGAAKTFANVRGKR